ncbi:MAG: hypothetical protein IPG05_16025 [Gemmatimonadetes bacterium]|nr:hypothetical protein [Gemmatimonadota bacterium]
MRRFVLLAVAVLLVPTTRAAAQTTTDTTVVVCPTGLSAAGTKVCTAALDGITMIHPLAALLMNGGNPRLGSAGVIGRFGHIALGLRATTAMAVVPDLTWAGNTDTVPVGRRAALCAARDSRWALSRSRCPPASSASTSASALVILRGTAPTFFTPVPGEPHHPVTRPSRSLRHSRRDVESEAADRLAPPSWALRRRRCRWAAPLMARRRGDLQRLGDRRVALHRQALRLVRIAAGAGVDLLGQGRGRSRDPGTGTVGEVLEPKLSGMRIVTALNLGVHVGPLHLVGEGGYQVGSNLALTTRYAENNPNAGKFFGGLGVVLAR